MPAINQIDPNVNDVLGDTGLAPDSTAVPKGGRNTQSTGHQDGKVTTSAPLIEDTSDTTRTTKAAPASFRRQLLDAQSRAKLSPLGEEYLEKFTAQLEKDGLKLTPIAINGAYIAQDDRYGILIVFEEAARRSGTNEFVPLANVIGRIMNDGVVKDQIKAIGVDVLTGVLITTEDYGVKNDIKYSLAANRIRNYINLALGAEVSMQELETYQYRIITNPTTIKENLIKYSPHGVAPYFMYGACVEVCMDPRISEGRRNRRDYNEDEYDWIPLFTIGAITEFVRCDDEDQANRPIVTITSYEGSFLSVKLLPFVLAVASEIFIYQGLWLEPFKNFTETGYNLGQLYVDERTGIASRLEDRHDMKEFLKEHVSQPVLCVDVQAGRFTFPGFEILANSELEQLQNELDDLTDDSHVQISDPVQHQLEYYTGYVGDDDVLYDSRAIHYFRVVEHCRDLDLLDRFRNYSAGEPDNRIKAIADAGFNNYQGRTNMLTTVYPTTKYLIDANVVIQMTEMTSVLNIIRNTTRDSNPAFTSEMLAQQANTYRTRTNSLYNDRASNQRSTGILFGGSMRGRGRNRR